jgi:capsular polysaccharide biosynthesis protein
MEQAGFSGHYVVRGAFVRECMQMLGIPRERVIPAPEQPTMFRSGWFATPICADDILKYPDVFLDLRARFIAAAKRSKPDFGARLWIDRDDKNTVNQGRELINKDEVYPLLERYGFRILDMARLPVVDQIAAASGASIIGGTHGAGFVHVFFMEPRSRVIECFTPSLINSGIIEICRLLRHRYSMVVPNNAYGAYPYGMQLKLDCRQLDLILQGIDD